MGHSDIDIIEVRLYDPTYKLFYKGKAKITKLTNLNSVLESKEGVKLVSVKGAKVKESGWFD